MFIFFQKLYKEKYEKTKSEFSVVPDALEERSIKVVQPWLSKVRCISGIGYGKTKLRKLLAVSGIEK